MTASDYVKNQPHIQGKILTPNPYSALAEYPPLSYAKAAAEGSTSKATVSTTKEPETSTKPTYYVKPQKQHLMTTQFTKPITLPQLKTFVNRAFYPDCFYPTDNITKNHTFYEFILVDSRSIEVTHYPDPKDKNSIAYSTCKILNIYQSKDLGFIHHHSTKPFVTPGFHIQGYTYTDYQNAIFRAFYIRPYDHSWIFSFDQSCSKAIPGWFAEWWYWFEPLDAIYPTNLLKTSFEFYKKHIPDQPIGPLNKIYFHIDMGIPWICSWHFQLSLHLQDMPYSLLREFRVKWWEKYNLDRCSYSNIQKYFDTIKQATHAAQTVSKSIPLLLPSQRQQPTPKPSSPATSTASSSEIKKSKQSKKEKLAQLIDQLMHSSSDEEGEVNHDTQDPFGGPLAQDPFEE